MSDKNIQLAAKPNGKAVRKKNIGRKSDRLGGGARLASLVSAAAQAPLVRNICRVGLVAAISVGCVMAHDFLIQCDYFRAEVISVKGCQRLDRETALEQAGVFPGINILSVNLRLARNRLLAHPWVADARVSRELPAGLHIHVKEHTPLAILEIDRRFIVNENGKIFKEYGTSDLMDVPVARGLEYMDIPAMDKPGTEPFQALMAALRMGGRPDSILPNRSVEAIQVDREMGLTLCLSDDAPGSFSTVTLGFDDRVNGLGYDVKYKRFQEVVDFLAREGAFLRVSAIDLTDLDRIVIHPAKNRDAMHPKSRDTMHRVSTVKTESLSKDRKEV